MEQWVIAAEVKKMMTVKGLHWWTIIIVQHFARLQKQMKKIRRKMVPFEDLRVISIVPKVRNMLLIDPHNHVWVSVRRRLRKVHIIFFSLSIEHDFFFLIKVMDNDFLFSISEGQNSSLTGRACQYSVLLTTFRKSRLIIHSQFLRGKKFP